MQENHKEKILEFYKNDLQSVWEDIIPDTNLIIRNESKNTDEILTIESFYEDYFMKSNKILITGKNGSGKSQFLKKIFKHFLDKSSTEEFLLPIIFFNRKKNGSFKNVEEIINDAKVNINLPNLHTINFNKIILFIDDAKYKFIEEIKRKYENENFSFWKLIVFRRANTKASIFEYFFDAKFDIKGFPSNAIQSFVQNYSTETNLNRFIDVNKTRFYDYFIFNLANDLKKYMRLGKLYYRPLYVTLFAIVWKKNYDTQELESVKVIYDKLLEVMEFSESDIREASDLAYKNVIEKNISYKTDKKIFKIMLQHATFEEYLVAKKIDSHSTSYYDDLIRNAKDKTESADFQSVMSFLKDFNRKKYLKICQVNPSFLPVGDETSDNVRKAMALNGNKCRLVNDVLSDITLSVLLFREISLLEIDFSNVYFDFDTFVKESTSTLQQLQLFTLASCPININLKSLLDFLNSHYHLEKLKIEEIPIEAVEDNEKLYLKRKLNLEIFCLTYCDMQKRELTDIFHWLNFCNNLKELNLSGNSIPGRLIIHF